MHSDKNFNHLYVLVAVINPSFNVASGAAAHPPLLKSKINSCIFDTYRGGDVLKIDAAGATAGSAVMGSVFCIYLITGLCLDLSYVSSGIIAPK